MKTILTCAFAASALVLTGCESMNDDGMSSTASTSTTASASTQVTTVGGAEMYPTRTIVENAVNSPIHRTLVAAVTAAGLVDTLNSPGPFTVFAPTDDAFGKVPLATSNSLMEPANRATLTKVLTYHVVPGRISSADLAEMIRNGGGSTTLTTVAGEKLTFTAPGGSVMIAGQAGSMAHVTQADVMQSNGIIHVVDGVLMPTL